MSLATLSVVLRALSFFVAILGDSSFASADIADHEFRRVNSQVKTGATTALILAATNVGAVGAAGAVLVAQATDKASSSR